MENKFSQDINDYKEKVKKAMDVVEGLNLEEPYKTNAFNTILKDLLEKKKPLQNVRENKINSSPSEKNRGTLLNFGEIPYFDNFDKLNWKHKMLNILQWAKHNHLEKGLLTSEFVSIFKERFGMPYIDSGKINKEITRRLLKTPLITRMRTNQRDFRWFITPKGEEYLKKEEKNEIPS
jgi:hypothetical protein